MSYIIYKVSITPFAVSTPAQAGFLDNKKVEQYGLIDGLTYDQCQIKRRANLRWADIMESISLEANPIISNVNATGATITEEATEFYFEVGYSASGLPAVWDNGVLLTGVDAVKHMVARALITDSEDQCEVFDPIMTDPIADKFHLGGNVVAHIAVGSRFIKLAVGKLADTIDLAKANISVTV